MKMNKSDSREFKVERQTPYRRIILIALITLSIIQQLPVVKDNYYSNIRILLYLGFGILTIISIKCINKYLKYNIVRDMLYVLFYSIILTGIASIFSINDAAELELIIPFGIMISSLSIKFSSKQLNNFVLIYVLLSTVLGLSSIFFYGQGFKILDTYFLAYKNQIGPILGISTLLVGLSLIKKTKLPIDKMNTVTKFVIFFALLSSIIVIRNRASIFSLLIILLLILMKSMKFKLTLKKILFIQLFITIITIFVIYGNADWLYDVFYKSFFGNLNIRDLNSVSAGRTSVYIQAFEYVQSNPILGEFIERYKFDQIPHNYIFNKWVRLGLVGAIPYIFLYLKLWFFSLKNLFGKPRLNNWELPSWVLLFSLLISIFEYSYPYGPGVSLMMVWFLIGQYFRMISIGEELKGSD